MQKNLNEILCRYNSHILDNNIEFIEETHTYIIKSDNQTKYTSTTTWVNSLFPEFDTDKIIENMMKGKNWKEGHKYWGLTPEQIKDLWNSNKENVTKCGTDLHYEIECFYNNDKLEYPYNNFNLYQFYEFMQEKKINYENEYNNKILIYFIIGRIIELLFPKSIKVKIYSLLDINIINKLFNTTSARRIARIVNNLTNDKFLEIYKNNNHNKYRYISYIKKDKFNFIINVFI